MNAAQDRRPGLREMAKDIALRNPNWSKNACITIAKLLWIERQRRAKSTGAAA